jgi:hypothetical protein
MLIKLNRKHKIAILLVVSIITISLVIYWLFIRTVNKPTIDKIVKCCKNNKCIEATEKECDGFDICSSTNVCIIKCCKNNKCIQGTAKQCQGSDSCSTTYDCRIKPKPTNPIIPDNIYSFIYSQNDNITEIVNNFNKINNDQGGKGANWGNNSYILLFQPGTYDFNYANLPINFYTSVRGLGMLPEDTYFKNCTITIQGISPTEIVHTTPLFWRDMENIKIDGDINWYVSQACPLRRIECSGKLAVNNGVHNPDYKDGSWGSGGWISNIKNTGGNIKGGLQQQFCYKNIEASSIEEVGMNTTIINSVLTPSDKTNVQISRCKNGEKANTVTVVSDIKGFSKPWLVFDGIILPLKDKNGCNFSPGGQKINISRIAIVDPSYTLDDINNAIGITDGMIFTPGKYKYDDSILVKKDNYVILGLGWPIINAGKNKSPIFTITGSDVWINSLILDAGTGNPDALLHISSGTNNQSVRARVHDIFTRILTPADPNLSVNNMCKSMIIIDQDFTYVENIWLWKADHQPYQNGKNITNWSRMINSNGLTVNGNNVIICGLAVEHQSGIMTKWNGEDGECYFYQSEFPYDNPYFGDASYVVDSKVNNHKLYGAGSYFVKWINSKPPQSIKNTVKIPTSTGIKWNSVIGANWSGYTAVQNVIGIGDEDYGKVNQGGMDQVAYCNSFQ